MLEKFSSFFLSQSGYECAWCRSVRVGWVGVGCVLWESSGRTSCEGPACVQGLPPVLGTVVPSPPSHTDS